MTAVASLERIALIEANLMPTHTAHQVLQLLVDAVGIEQRARQRMQAGMSSADARHYAGAAAHLAKTLQQALEVLAAPDPLARREFDR